MNDQDALIEKKIDGTLTPEESQRFNLLLRADPVFTHSYASQRVMITIFQQHQKEALHQKLEAGYQTYRKNRTLRRYYYGAAASLLFLLLGGWFWWSNSSNRLFVAYYQPYAVISPRGAVPATENRATNYYNQEQYAKALTLLQNLQQTSNNRDYWTLLLGNAYLQVDSIAQARAQFKQVANSPNDVYQQYGRWYEAMSYLKVDETGKAKLTLQPIADQPGLFQRKAQQLLNEM